MDKPISSKPASLVSYGASTQFGHPENAEYVTLSLSLRFVNVQQQMKNLTGGWSVELTYKKKTQFNNWNYTIIG